MLDASTDPGDLLARDLRSVERATDAGVKDELQRSGLNLPRAWQRFDCLLLRGTELLVGAVGITFTVLVTAEVFSRYVFSFSIVWVNSAAIFLMVWFFLLGAGLALRQGAHVGFDLLTNHLSPFWARAAFILAQLLSFLFFVLMTWSGIRTIGPASRQMEGALGISLMWVMLAFPVGFLFLLYNQVAMFVAAIRGHERRARSS